MGTLIVNQYLSKLWTPSEMTTALWLDAADVSTVILDSQYVSQWIDKSGNDRHALSITSADRPIYVNNALGFNGKPAIEWFANTNRLYVQNLHPVLSNNDSYSVTILFRGDRYNNNPVLFHQPDGTSYRYLVEVDVSGGWFGTGRAEARKYLTPTWSTTVPSFLSAMRAGGGQGFVFANGTEHLNRNDFTVTSATSNDIVLGGYSNSSLTFDGMMAEVLVTSSLLTLDNRQKIEGYLAHKWGLDANLPATHPYKNNPPYV